MEFFPLPSFLCNWVPIFSAISVLIYFFPLLVSVYMLLLSKGWIVRNEVILSKLSRRETMKSGKKMFYCNFAAI